MTPEAKDLSNISQMDQTRRVLGITKIRERSIKGTWLSEVPWHRMAERPLPQELIGPLELARDVEILVEPQYKGIVIAGIATRGNLTPDDIRFRERVEEWGHQEKGHGEFFHGLLAEDARIFADTNLPSHEEVVADLLNKRNFRKRKAPTLIAPIATVAPEHFRLAVSLSGIVTEDTTVVAYSTMMSLSDHPVLQFGLSQIIPEEKTHGRGYYEQAYEILSKSESRRKFGRTFVEHILRPVGVRELGYARFDESVNLLIGNERATTLVKRADARFGSLPGLSGLTPIANIVTSSRARMGQ